MCCAALLLWLAWRWQALPGAYWRADDPAILLHALQSPGLAAFHDPADWQKLQPSNLTPWLTLAYKLDLALGGLRPAVFYGHQLLALGGVVLAAHALARRWLSPAWSGALVLLGLAGAPTAAVVETLMTRHYLEGLLFVLLATLASHRALRGPPGRAAWAWAGAGAAAYALACSAKEVYVPWVLWLPLLAWHADPAQRRWRLLWPAVLVALAYVPWRFHMLGSAIGGYGQAQTWWGSANLQALGRALGVWPEAVFGATWPLALGVLMLAAVPALARLAPAARRHALATAGLLAALLIGPLTPLALAPGLVGWDRYFFLPWWGFSLLLVASLRGAAVALPGRRWPVALGLAMALLLAAAAHWQDRQVAQGRDAALQEFDVLGRFLDTAPATTAYLPPPNALASWWYVSSLCEIRQRQGAGCAQALIPGWPVADGLLRLQAYDAGVRAMVDITPRLAQERQRAAAIDRSRPLSVQLSLERGWAHWQLGPYTEGQYFIVSPVLGRYPLPASGHWRTPFTRVDFQIHHQSATGVLTASPTLEVSPGRPVVWQRAADAAPPGSRP